MNTDSRSAPETPRLVFGIYPGGPATAERPDAGPLDDPSRIEAALDRLQPPGRPFLVRAYVQYKGQGRAEHLTPPDVTRYVHTGRRLDLALCFRSPDGDLGDWAEFIRGIVARYGPYLATLQVAEEPNNPDPNTGGDGASPQVRQAIVEGVVVAKDAARRLGFNTHVGFNATPSFDPSDGFWPDMARRVTPEFLEALDYVGLDFFPDVFRPIPPVELPAAVAAVLAHFRQVNLAAAGIPATVPIRITENGWPTGPERAAERQAAVLETVVRLIHERRGEVNISSYAFFDLRDAESGTSKLMSEFGLLRDDYTPKPAFETYRRLIAELGADSWT